MNPTCFLLMWLEGPLQSWGFDSRFCKKNTLEFPTKSGLLGMLCCARGAGGEQKEWLAAMAPLKTKILAYSQGSQAPLLRDFQMIGSGYNESDPFEALMMPRTSEGKKPVGGGSKLTYRYYLQNARFAAIVEIPQAEAGLIAQALTNPVWDLFLGRKNCAPSDFIFRGIFPSEDDAIAKALEIAKEKELTEKFRVSDGSLSDGSLNLSEVIALNDVPVTFGEHKTYKQRYVTMVYS